MKPPAFPIDEEARLAELRSYAVLDTGADETFDALTKLVAELFDVPIALVSLVDGQRQWFKSRVGLEATETTRDISFCGHVVFDKAPLVVEDATKDPRFADNPLVTQNPNIRFYAGVPLRTPNGFVLGTLCAIDRVPRQLSKKQLDVMKHLSEVAIAQLSAHKRERELLDARILANEAARRYEALFEVLDEGVTVLDRHGTISAVNKSAERILGLEASQMTGHTPTDPMWSCFHEDGSDFPGETHPPMIALRTGEPQRNVMMGVRKPSGELTWIQVNALPVAVEGQKPHAVVTTFHDVTPIQIARQAQEGLQRAEQILTMGTLAGGLSHEINNPLTYIISNIEFAREEIDAEKASLPKRVRELPQVLAEAREGADRIRRIVQAIKALAAEASSPKPILVERAVDAAVSVSEHLVRDRATLVKKVTPGIMVLADEGRLAQILAALILNAAQAFPKASTKENLIEVIADKRLDGRIAITVKDNGPGVPEHLHRRIFDPFFTTKPFGSATGLGLSIAQGHASSMKGELHLFDAKPNGACFELVLPAARLS